MDLAHVAFIVTTIGTAVGMTWALRSKLSDIEVALRERDVRSDSRHANHEVRITNLEDWKKRR